ncbi:MAG: restriction endonuclease subunit S, partial [Sandaracinus sp.]
LDPSVPMKDSGVGWIGGVPTSWEVAKICLVARLESGHTPSRQHPEYWVPEECTTPWFSLADIWQLRPGIQEYVSETAERISASGMANSAARLLPAGTVVLSRTASVGFSGIMAQPMATTQDFANWIPGPRLSSEFLLYGLRAMVSEFERVRYGSTHQTIYMPDIRRLTIPLPSREVQAAIVSALRAGLGRVDAAADRMRQSVERLREYRQALITAAVTGQIDVSDERAVAAHDERVESVA